MDKVKCINKILNEMDGDVLIDIWNDYCSNQDMDKYIHPNEEYIIDELFSKPSEALRCVMYGKYNMGDDYMIFNGYGNLESFEIYDALNYIDMDILINYIIDNDCREIQEVWYEDVIACFVEYFNEKFEDIQINEDYDIFDNLITEDWDDICETIFEELKEEKKDYES